MLSIDVPLWAWLAFGYLAVGAYVRSSPPLLFAQVRAARHYAHCSYKLHRSMVRDPWRSRSEIHEAELLFLDAVADTAYLLDSVSATSAFETLVLWPETFRQSLVTVWDANQLCDARRENVAKRHSLRNLRLGKT